MWYLDGFQAGMGCFVNLGEAALGLLVNEDQRMERLAALLESSELKSAVENYNDRGRLTEQVLAVLGTISQSSKLNGLVKYCGESVRCRMNWTLECVEVPGDCRREGLIGKEQGECKKWETLSQPSININ